MTEPEPLQALCDALEPVIERAVERALRKVLSQPRAALPHQQVVHDAGAWDRCVIEVASLLGTLFSKREAIIELHLSDGLLSVLPVEGVDAMFFRELAQAYRRRGLINARFFDDLVSLREEQHEPILAARERWAHLWR